MSRTKLAGIVLAAAATSILPATAGASPTAGGVDRAGFAIDIGTSEELRGVERPGQLSTGTRENGIIAILIGVVQPPAPAVFSGDAYDNEMG